MAQTKDDIAVYDYIVIGGGTSGAVVARRLAEGDKGSSVCLLEAGPSHECIVDGRIPAAWPVTSDPFYDWNYATTPQKGCNNRVITTPRARFLGGCSAINGMLIIRGAKADYDRIESLGNPGWSWKELLPFFKASETFHPTEWHQADLSVHGNSGPLHTSPHPLAPISKKALESFIDYGFEYKPDMFVQGEYEGVGHAVRTICDGGRTTSADFVHNCAATNLTVKTGIHVDRIILEKNSANSDGKHDYRAVGVEAHCDKDKQSIIIKAKKEIILSAGSYNSPVILMHSGIGPADHLREMGIDCKVDLPGVGSNLQDHIIVYTSYQIKDPSLTLDRILLIDPEARAAAIEEWHATKTGVMTRFPFGPFALKRIDKTILDPVWESAKREQQQLNPSVNDPTGQWPNQPHIEYWTTEFYFTPPHLLQPDGLPYNPSTNEAVMTLVTFLCSPKGRGTVRLSSNDPMSKPIIDHAYLEDDLDVAVLAEGCRIGHEVIMKGNATKDLIVGPWPKTMPHPTDQEGWKQHVRAFSGTCYHPSGTCKMAPDSDPMGVIDHRLRVRKVDGLRVADVSVLPIINNGHTQAPAYVVGEKAAHMILQDATASD